MIICIVLAVLLLSSLVSIAAIIMVFIRKLKAAKSQVGALNSSNSIITLREREVEDHNSTDSDSSREPDELHVLDFSANSCLLNTLKSSL
jgi:flagellar basal body-associated protein FliL